MSTADLLNLSGPPFPTLTVTWSIDQLPQASPSLPLTDQRLGEAVGPDEGAAQEPVVAGGRVDAGRGAAVLLVGLAQAPQAAGGGSLHRLVWQNSLL